MLSNSTDIREIRHFHLFCGLGGGARGFNQGEARVGNMVAKFRCIGGIDVDRAAVRDFGKLAGVPGTLLDLFDRDQYKDFHGVEPPSSWREATALDIQGAAGNERPHIVFLSAPCKGFSGLLSDSRSKSKKYQALNRLTLRGVWLMLEAFADDPPELIVFENVPRIASRGRALLDRIETLLRHYGYAVAETTHDCGEIGGLGQSRKRFLMVARHTEKVPPFLYEPKKRPLRSVGDVIGRFPFPGAGIAGPMHRVPSLQWKTWVRLAFVQAGSDWRSLNNLAIQDGLLRDYLIIPEMYNNSLGVVPWDNPMGTVTGNSRPATGAFSVADPRCENQRGHYFGLCAWGKPSGALSGRDYPSCGRYAVSDPRFPAGGEYGQIGVRKWDQSTGTVTSQRSPIQGGFSVADPRMPESRLRQNGIYRVVKYDDSTGTVISGSTTGMGAFAVADPRTGLNRRTAGDPFVGGGHYGVVPWLSHCGAISSAAGLDNGRWSVADPRLDHLPAAGDRLIARIIAEDNTWHRPFTTLELAALQGLVEPEEQLELDGLSDSAWRERIGNAVPPPAARAIAGMMGQTLLLAWSGETFALGCTPIWVRPVAVALSVAQAQSSQL